MKKIVICISGFGSNLQAIIDVFREKRISAKIVLVASNKKNAYGLIRAQNAGLKTFVSKNIDEIFEKIKKENPDLIVLAGFMKVLPPHFVNTFKKKIINIHPSLLPKFPGLNSIKRAYESGERETGVTIHYVDEGIDTGEIIVQEKILIKKEYSLEDLENRVHALEHRIYPEIILKLLG